MDVLREECKLDAMVGRSLPPVPVPGSNDRLPDNVTSQFPE